MDFFVAISAFYLERKKLNVKIEIWLDLTTVKYL